MPKNTIRSLTQMSVVPAHFWAKVNKNGPIVRPELDPCWEWAAGLFSQGYGCYVHKRIALRANRVSFFLTHGRDAERFVLHHCDNRKCVNPAHLYEGDEAQNAIDCASRGRNPNQSRRRLSKRDILAIRSAYSKGIYERKDLARWYGISPETVKGITTRDRYAYIA